MLCNVNYGRRNNMWSFLIVVDGSLCPKNDFEMLSHIFTINFCDVCICRVCRVFNASGVTHRSPGL
jgi:hypothetical protein